MMKHEFEELAGYEVSYEDYTTKIEPMYMALPDSVSKQDFVKMIDKKAFALPTAAEILRQIKKEAAHLYEICGRSCDYKSELRLKELAYAYAKRKYGLDYANDIKCYIYLEKEYEYPEIQRGCTYPKTLVIGWGSTDYARIKIAG